MSVTEQLSNALLKRGYIEAELTQLLSGVRVQEYENKRIKAWMKKYAYQRTVLLVPTKKDFKDKLEAAKKLEAELDLIIKEMKI